MVECGHPLVPWRTSKHQEKESFQFMAQVRDEHDEDKFDVPHGHPLMTDWSSLAFGLTSTM